MIVSMLCPINAPRRFSRRRFLRLAGVTAAATALSSCAFGPRPTPVGSPGAPVQLVYQDWNTEWFPLMAQQLLAQFHASHPGIRVFYVPDPPSETFEEEALADFEAGTAPDVFDGCCSFFPIWAQKGFTLDLRPYVAADLDQATLDDWDRAQYLSFFTGNGQQYGLPKYHGALALYYNKDLLDEYGVDYPDQSWDHDDYLAAMKRLTHDRNGDGRTDLWGSMLDVSWDRIQVHINAWGGHIVDPADATRSLIAEPPALEAQEWIRARIWDDRVMPSPLDVQYLGTSEAFVARRVAMVEDGSWALKAILSEADFRVGVAPFPAGPARRATLATTDGFGIYAQTRHPDAAWELLKFLISRDYGRAMARAHFLQPARASLLEEWVSFIHEEFPDTARDTDIAAFADGHLKGYSVVAEAFANQADARRLIYDGWEQIFALGQAPVSLMTAVSEEVERAQPKSG
jgi:multiple sugar transport system substrate-binding protein